MARTECDRVLRLARRRGLELVRPRRLDPSLADFGRVYLVEPERDSLSLGEAELLRSHASEGVGQDA